MTEENLGLPENSIQITQNHQNIIINEGDYIPHLYISGKFSTATIENNAQIGTIEMLAPRSEVDILRNVKVDTINNTSGHTRIADGVEINHTNLRNASLWEDGKGKLFSLNLWGKSRASLNSETKVHFLNSDAGAEVSLLGAEVHLLQISEGELNAEFAKIESLSLWGPNVKMKLKKSDVQTLILQETEGFSFLPEEGLAPKRLIIHGLSSRRVERIDTANLEELILRNTLDFSEIPFLPKGKVIIQGPLIEGFSVPPQMKQSQILYKPEGKGFDIVDGAVRVSRMQELQPIPNEIYNQYRENFDNQGKKTPPVSLGKQEVSHPKKEKLLS